ncbi:hypothetical protein [Altererythrobacter lauratis]|uniref:Uncharacterized protein n=1 Tax=Alteraurantiacibacter lauratis TaxID=2054627 RepID=A0ABV7EE46_9SPHN
MTKFTAFAAALLAAGSLAIPAAAQTETAPSAEREVSPAHTSTRVQRGEAQLARILEGFAATGETQRCVNAFRTNDITVIPYVGVVYEDGDKVYVARARRPEMLRDSDVPVFERFSSQICTTDVMRTIDRFAPNMQGSLFLEDFQVYTRIPAANRN